MKTIRVAGIAALLFFSTVTLFSFDSMNRQIGIVYLKNAAANYLTGNYDNAEQFLENAREFYSESSDYEYLRGLIKLEKNNSINTAVSHFQTALSYDNWMLLEKKKCVTDLSRLLFRKKDYKTLIDTIENQAYPDYRDNDLMYLYLLSIKNEKMTEKYRQLLEASVIRYADDYRFSELYVPENQVYRDKILEDRISFKNEEGGLAVFLKAAMDLEDGLKKTDYIKNYLNRGGKDTSAFIEYYRLTGDIDSEKLNRLLDMNFFEEPGNRLRLLSILPSMEMRKKVQQKWQSYTGNVYYDLNKDGYFEELHLYEGGRPVGLSIDRNQDGVIEVMIIFENSKPSELIISGNEFIRISFQNYPIVNEMSISDGVERDVYTFLKDRLELEIYETREEDEKMIYKEGVVEEFISDFEKLKENAVRISSYSGGAAGDGYTLLKQELERRAENYTILTIYNRIVGNYVYQQVNNKKTVGFADIDFDNLIDIKETYAEGNIVSIEADNNKNGIYDYKLSFENGMSFSWWDLDEDGTYDCRQYEENGILINEYSSELNGNFDIIERN